MAHMPEIKNNFNADDGLTIFYRHRPANKETGHMVIAHGLGEHSGRYAHIIDRIVDMGISVWALDHRGHGQSEGKRGHIDSMDQYINDFKKMIDIAKTDMPAGMYHEIYNEQIDDREKVLNDLVSWLRMHLGTNND